MKVLVTGASGFVGRHVVEALLSRGDVDVIASARSADSFKQFPWHHRVRIVSHAIDASSHGAHLFDKFHRPDKLIHLAWTGLPNYKQHFHFEEVLPAQYFFLKSLISGGLKDVTVTGTCLEYGMQEGRMDEGMPAMPANPYALAKDTLRRFLESLQSVQEFDLKWVRLFYMYGDGQSRQSIIPQLEQAIQRGDASFNMSGGEQQRDYLPVTKVALNIINIALQNEVTGIINCSSGQAITVRKLVEDFIEEKRANISLNLGYYPYTDYEPFSFYGANEKLKNINTKHE